MAGPVTGAGGASCCSISSRAPALAPADAVTALEAVGPLHTCLCPKMRFMGALARRSGHSGVGPQCGVAGNWLPGRLAAHSPAPACGFGSGPPRSGRFDCARAHPRPASCRRHPALCCPTHARIGSIQHMHVADGRHTQRSRHCPGSCAAWRQRAACAGRARRGRSRRLTPACVPCRACPFGNRRRHCGPWQSVSDTSQGGLVD